tara:strand:- start:235 stop:357 length:123 start_codon:yes stop_codon:yes gene_type:complete
LTKKLNVVPFVTGAAAVCMAKTKTRKMKAQILNVGLAKQN